MQNELLLRIDQIERMEQRGPKWNWTKRQIEIHLFLYCCIRIIFQLLVCIDRLQIHDTLLKALLSELHCLQGNEIADHSIRQGGLACCIRSASAFLLVSA